MSFATPLRAYVQFARCAFQRRAAYRLANWTGVAVNFFFFLVHAQLFLALFGTRGAVAGWQAAEAVRYFATSEALLMVLGVMTTQTGLEFTERIRSGDVAVDLVRPVRLWARCLAESYGSAAYYVLMRASILYVAAVVLYGLALPLRPEVLLAPLSIVLGIAIASTLMYVASASAFWTEQAHGPQSALLVAIFFFGGIAVPLDFYPTPARTLADLLPFRGAVYTPVALASGKLSGAPLLFGLLHQVAWLAALVFLAHHIERRGAARLAVHGG